MRAIPPLIIADSMLTSSNLEETGIADYNAGTTYALAAKSKVLTGNTLYTVYESLQASNTGHTPASSPSWWKVLYTYYKGWDSSTTYIAGDIAAIDSTNSHVLWESIQGSNTNKPPATEPTFWQVYGTTPRWASFDLYRNSKTTRASPYIFTITPGVRINSMFLVGMVADSVNILITSGGLTVYNETIDLSTRNTVDWLSYYFGRFSTRPTSARFNLPMYLNAIITITATRASGDVSIGGFGVGVAEYLGRTQWQATSEGKNYSTVDRDLQGNASMVRRRRVPKTSQSLETPKMYIPRIEQLRDDLDATPAYWSAIDDDTSDYFEILQILGFYTKFGISVDYQDEARIQLDLEEI